MKRCEICGEAKPEEAFSKSYKNRCKGCVSSLAKYKRNSTKNALELKAFYEAPNPEIDVIVEELKASAKNQPKNMTKDEEVAFILKQDDEENCIGLIDWEQRRYELAKDAMQGFIANTDLFDRFEETGDTIPCLCSDSIEYADAMIKLLKGR